MATDANRFAKLKGRENYDTWKISAKSYLVIKKVWSCVANGLSPSATNDQKETDLTAWSELSLLIHESVYSYIAETKTAKDAWTALELAFEDSGLCRKVALLKQLVELKSSACVSMQEYINKLTMTSLKVKKAGLNLDDEIIASLMLAGLPNEFTPLVMAYENSSEKLTTEGVKTLLLQETRFDADDEGGEAFLVKKTNKKTNDFRCHCCGEIGHYARSCPERTGGKKVECDDKTFSHYVNGRRGGAL